MKNRFTSNTLVVICLLMTGLHSPLTAATWYVNQSEAYYKPQEYHNDKFGDFPPRNIEKTLMSDAAKTPAANNPVTKDTNKQAANVPQAQQPGTLDNTRQTYPQPNYGNYRQQNYNRENYNSYATNRPPNNMQMGNQGFNMNGPWNNRGSNINMPWNNSNTFNNPMNNNRSGFSMPWGGNGSGFSPWNNNNGWRR